MASKYDMAMREYESYTDTGAEKSAEITLSVTAGNITLVTLPTDVKGFRVYPRSYSVRFSAYNGSRRTVAAVGVSSISAVTVGDLTIGGIAKADQWETRLLPHYNDVSSVDRVVELRSTTASVVVDFEVF